MRFRRRKGESGKEALARWELEIKERLPDLKVDIAMLEEMRVQLRRPTEGEITALEGEFLNLLVHLEGLRERLLEESGWADRELFVLRSERDHLEGLLSHIEVGVPVEEVV